MCLAKGKLISKYYSLRKELKAIGVLSCEKSEADSDAENDLFPG